MAEAPRGSFRGRAHGCGAPETTKPIAAQEQSCNKQGYNGAIVANLIRDSIPGPKWMGNGPAVCIGTAREISRESPLATFNVIFTVSGPYEVTFQPNSRGGSCKNVHKADGIALPVLISGHGTQSEKPLNLTNFVDAPTTAGLFSHY